MAKRPQIQDSSEVNMEDIKVILRTAIPQKRSACKESVSDGESGGPLEDDRINKYANFPGLHEWDVAYPGILLGGRKLAQNREQLTALGVTHVLNASEGRDHSQVATNADYYSLMGISYLGIKADDSPAFKLAPFFSEASDFINCAIESNGKVYVHCYYGISRSATLVLAYLISRQSLSLAEAITQIRKTRLIYPNDGFLQELCDFANSLRS